MEPTEKKETKDTQEIAEEENGEKEPELIPSNFSIPIHTLISEAQSTHGLRHNDYAQYHSYCTRRLSRIRHAKPVRRDLTFGVAGYKAEKAKSKSTGGGGNQQHKKGGRHAFHPRGKVDVADANTHVNYTLVGLYNSERAWAHAMELKEEYEELRAGGASNKKTTNQTSVLGGNTRSSPGSKRQHYLKRLKKASKHATEMEALAAQVCGDRTKVEARAYASWMRGNWFLEVADWKNACKEYGSAFTICQALANGTALDDTTSSNDVNDSNSNPVSTTAEALQLRDFFSARATNVIQPLLRYCQYELQQEGNLDETEMLALMLKTQEETLMSSTNTSGDANGDNDFLRTKLDSIRENKLQMEASEGSKMASISFRGHDVNVQNTRLRVALLKIVDLKEDLEKIVSAKKKSKKGSGSSRSEVSRPSGKEDDKFLALLSGYDDAISIISEDLKEYMTMTSGPAVNAKRFECQSLLGYVKYEKLKLLMKRNETMVEGLREGDVGKPQSANSNVGMLQDEELNYKRVEEIAHLYDTLLQDARAVASLPGGGDGSNVEEGVEVEDEFVLEANANVVRIRALRCYYVGRMYAADTVAEYAKAVALLEQAQLLTSQAAEEIAACQDMEGADEYISSMVSLEKEIIGAKCRAQACAYISRCGTSASSATTGATLLRRLDDFDSGGATFRLADAPPSLEPIPCKPTFFDIANNHVMEFPEEELQSHIKSHTQQSRGILGWFRRSNA